MNITYTAPVRSHHYPYADAFFRAGKLAAFISGFSRLSPRSPFPNIGQKLKRHDFLMTLYLACLKFNIPFSMASLVYKLSNSRLDKVSYSWASRSDVFIYYRTTGLNTTRRLHKEGSSTLCIMEEVNSHVEFANSLLIEEFKSLGLKMKFQNDSDHDLRLECYDEADCILCPSQFVKDSFLLKGFAPDRLLMVNFGFPPILTTDSKYGYDGTVFRLLYVGQINYRKGLRYAIEAFRKLKHPKKEFWIVGPQTPVSGLETTQIPDAVFFTGVLKGEELNEQYRRASVFILPSLEEGLALVQGEALSFGLPLLITTNTGGSDLITNGVEGFITAPRDANALFERMQQMADDPLLLQQMSFAALRTAKALGSWDIAALSLIRQINKILGKDVD